MADPLPRRRFALDVPDALRAIATLGGTALLGYGCWLHYPPLGFIVGGGLLAAVGVLAAVRAH